MKSSLLLVWLACFWLRCLPAAGSLRAELFPRVRHHHEQHWGPQFETEGHHLAVAVPAGAPAALNCKVAMLHDKTVLWLRRTSDRVSLLTVGLATYSADPRLSVHFQYPNNWRLLFSRVSEDDQGSYLCQVSTHPPRVQTTNLTVLPPEVSIVDEDARPISDRYYKRGSTIDLTCRVMTALPKDLLWFKDSQALPKQAKIIEDSSPRPDGSSVSRLSVPRADKRHAGTYACSLRNQSTAWVHVHVLNGENQAAVHQDAWGGSTSKCGTGAIFVICSLATIIQLVMPRN